MNLMNNGLRFGLWDRACFDPGTIAIASLAAGAIGTGVSALGAIQSGEAQKSAADYQSQVASNNAQIASQNALAATQAGNAQAETAKIKNDQIVGAMEAAQASSGVDVGSGSPLAARVSQTEIGTLNQETIRNQAARQAYGYQTQALSDKSQAELDTAQGQNAATAGTINGISSILGGASSVGGKYAAFQQVAGNAPKGLSLSPTAGTNLGGLY
jgi:hypothetical protein